ncbi:hypothetical protein RHMOL_Rhmol10G0296900 [Rhododendron molle]|uniref:Uncharacterized protein n=1 Tax=Rhododendron molle TaxID=49168 RepID=A0ACC0M8W8_RHOML|nr:hypothetical protein RHMOL_Rhmol10G0296900 [Rhododendron molle]
MSDVDPSRPWAWHISDPGVLPKIFRQTTEHGQCGCCSMVAASTACSATYAIKAARPPNELAVQELINEVPKHYRDEMTLNDNDPCASSYTSTSFKNIRRMSKSLFVLQVHHGGYFVGSPKTYLGGKFDCITNVDSDLMSYFEVLGLMKELGIELENANMYHKMPDCDLDGGLREIKTDRDVVDMFAIHSGRSTIAVYVENIGVPLDVEEVVIVSAEKEVVIMSAEEKEDDGNESEKDGSKCSERSINLSDLEFFADGDEIFDSAKPVLTSNLLANECVNGKFEVGSGSGSGQHYFNDDIVIEVDEVEYEDWNTRMQSLDGDRTGQFTEFFEDTDISDPGVLPKIFRQTTEHGQCGCCSMVAASTACSAAYTIKTARPPYELTVQELINEVPKHYRDEMTLNDYNPCASSYMSTSFKYIKRESIAIGQGTAAMLNLNLLHMPSSLLEWDTAPLAKIPIIFARTALDPIGG